MKISIITVAFNSSKTIRDTIKSVQEQTYDNIEHIIVDGNSNDGTQDIIQEYKNIKFISEPDEGIYFAMNKGIDLASGEIIGILNSDDIFFDTEILSLVANTFIQERCDLVYGDTVIVKEDNLDSIVRYWKSSNFIPGSFKSGWHPPHPSFFVRKSVYERFGCFDTSIDVSADFELMLRFMEKNEVSSSYIQRTLSRMRVGGHSQNIKNIYKGAKSINRAFKKNEIKINLPYYFLIRYTAKIKEIIIAKLFSQRITK